MKHDNKFVQRLNSKFGFQLASHISISRILKNPQKKMNMRVMEMKI